MNNLQKVWNVLFNGLPLDPDEYVELAFDDRGDKNFNRAYHLKNLEELEEKVNELMGKCNITISPAIRRIEDSKKNKRTGGDYVSKQQAIILDIDNPNNRSRLQEEDAKKWYSSWEQVWRKPKNENTP